MADTADTAAALRQHAEYSRAKPGAFRGLATSLSYPVLLRLQAGPARLTWGKRIVASSPGGDLKGCLAALEVLLSQHGEVLTTRSLGTEILNDIQTIEHDTGLMVLSFAGVRIAAAHR